MSQLNSLPQCLVPHKLSLIDILVGGFIQLLIVIVSRVRIIKRWFFSVLVVVGEMIMHGGIIDGVGLVLVCGEFNSG